MKNPFSSDVPEEKKLVRNVFDLGRSSVFTTEFGQLYPFFLQEVIPGDSVQLDAQVGLRGMPTLFPLQTKMRCSIEFYYVRNRTLYKDWEDFVYKTKDVESPWLKLNNERAKQMISTGSLGDALGVPSSIASSEPISRTVNFNVPDFYNFDFNSLVGHRTKSSVVSALFPHIDDTDHPLRAFSSPTRAYSKENSSLFYGYLSNVINFPISNNFSSTPFLISTILESYPTFDGYLVFLTPDNVIADTGVSETLFNCHFSAHSESSEVVVDYSVVPDVHSSLTDVTDYLINKYGSYKVLFLSIADSDGALISQPPYFSFVPTSADLMPSSLTYLAVPSGVFDATDDAFIDSNPFVGSNPSVKLSSLPFRAYEQCMNYYYRNDKNNPYVIDNQVQYNEFIPTHDGGADENVYDFHYRNWELDRFTSAVPSPQFGEAPLVGLTYNPSKGTATLKLEGASVTDSEGVVTQTDPQITVGVDDDGKLDSIIDFSKDVPSANLRKLQEQMQSNTGISINDLRVTNSFQRFLENTMRRGLRYRNQLKSHHHVSVDYPDIDVPQYIGGASGIVDTGQVTNMSQTGSVGLGDYIGTLAGGVSLKHKIQHYCVEHGWIIGIVSVCPLPSYPQSINKSLIKTNPFDYYLPEFGKIGYVPIHYSELMPLQTGSEQSVDDIFGYQKAWYDYMQSFDEVHGDFRIDLKDFVLTRTFAVRPQLSESFTVIDPEQLNDVFLANNIATPYGSTARWMCRSNVSCIMKRQIPMIGTPSLE